LIGDDFYRSLMDRLEDSSLDQRDGLQADFSASRLAAESAAISSDVAVASFVEKDRLKDPSRHSPSLRPQHPRLDLEWIPKPPSSEP
jgi:hypothetical protein